MPLTLFLLYAMLQHELIIVGIRARPMLILQSRLMVLFTTTCFVLLLRTELNILYHYTTQT